MALLVVLLLVSVTLGLSYAAMRSQITELRIHRNSGRQISARQVAVTGLTVALKKMHDQNVWDGVGSTVTGSLSSYENFQVSYTAGDPTLSVPASVDWDNPDFNDPYYDYPYRVTLLSTGYAADPDHPASIATYQIRAVVRLVPRQLPREPSDWKNMQRYTVYQTRKDSFEVDVPCRLEGRVRIQGKLKIGPHYPNDAAASKRYFEDLGKMQRNGVADFRPFDGPVDYPLGEQEGTYQVMLESLLGVTAYNVWINEVAADWVKPTSLTTYQIYEGGPVYTIPWLGTTLQNVKLAPDPKTNPLGIYYRDGSISIQDDVSIRGSLFCKDDIHVDGTGVTFEPVELPALHGEDDPVRLPVASCRDFIVEPTAGGSLRGLLAVFEDFEVKKSPDTVGFAIEGRLITRRLLIKEREPWNTADWGKLYDEYAAARAADTAVTPYFPLWLAAAYKLSPKPLLTIGPDSGPLAYHYHWKYPSDQIYQRHFQFSEDPYDPNDDGLRWELVQWTENP